MIGRMYPNDVVQVLVSIFALSLAAGLTTARVRSFVLRRALAAARAHPRRVAVGFVAALVVLAAAVAVALAVPALHPRPLAAWWSDGVVLGGGRPRGLWSHRWSLTLSACAMSVLLVAAFALVLRVTPAVLRAARRR